MGSTFQTHSKKQSQGPQGPDLGEVILDTLKPAFLEDYNNVWNAKDSICSIASLHVCTTTGWRRGISIGQTTVQKNDKERNWSYASLVVNFIWDFFADRSGPFFATDRALWWAFLYCFDQHLVHTQLPRHKMSTTIFWTWLNVCVLFIAIGI